MKSSPPEKNTLTRIENVAPCAADCDYRQLLGERVRALRQPHSAAKFIKMANVSRETLRKAEKGILTTSKTLEKIAHAAGLSQEARVELLTSWLKSLAGPDAGRIQIKIVNSFGLPQQTDSEVLLERLLGSAGALSVEQQRCLVDIVSSKERLTGLFSFLSPQKQIQ